MKGVEPSSLAWKARVIAVIRHPLNRNATTFRNIACPSTVQFQLLGFLSGGTLASSSNLGNLVGAEGFEPSSLSASDFKSGAVAYFATSPCFVASSIATF